ncbi:MAG: pyrroline-5-carboxylate reductase [Lentisphaerota bacterium]
MSLSHKRIVFLGAGNMAEAMVKGLIESGACKSGQVRVTDVSAGRLQYFSDNFGVQGMSHNRDLVADADVIVLAVKPQVFAEVLQEARPTLNRKALVISIAAGIPTARIESLLGEGIRVVRTMPNTPALVRKGITGMCAGRWAREDDLKLAEFILRAVGDVVLVEENKMDAVTAVSGSGPAYVFFLMEAMLSAAETLGLSGETAWKLVTATVDGSAELIMKTGDTAADLRKRVTSKGGTTAAALEVLEKKDVFNTVVDAVLAANRRAHELSSLT